MQGDASMTPIDRAALREAASKAIRDHVENKTPTRCEPMFLDGEDWWKQIRRWPDLGLMRVDVGPHGKQSKVKRERVWRHNLLDEGYPTLNELLAALEATP